MSSDLVNNLTFSAKQVLADGTSLVTITAVINSDADPATRTVLFTTSSGSFVGGTDSTISKGATFENEKLIARVQLKAPLTPGSIVVKAKMVLPNEKRDFTVSDSIQAQPSLPSSLILSASAFAVKINFGGEVTLQGQLLNASGNPVSLGTNVSFDDRYENGAPVNGRFRAKQASSNSTSTVSAIYSPGAVAANQKIWIYCYVTTPPGVPTTVKDSVLINTIPN